MNAARVLSVCALVVAVTALTINIGRLASWW